jgi:hypothetical protein
MPFSPNLLYKQYLNAHHKITFQISFSPNLKHHLVLCNGTTGIATAPGENFEVHQTCATEDWHPDPFKSLPLDKARQAFIDDILALYSCEPTIERVRRYTPDCVYDDQFVYANDRYKIAGQWVALPKLFEPSRNEGYQVVCSEDEVVQFKNEQVSPLSTPRNFPTNALQFSTFKITPRTATINALATPVSRP